MNRRQFLQSASALPFLGLLDTGQVFALDNSTSNATGLLLSDHVLQHRLSDGHPESPQRYLAIRDQLEKAGLIKQCTSIQPRSDMDEWLRLIHSEEHIQSIKQLGETHNIVSAVTGGVLSAVDHVCQENVKRAFCVTRPPGHHATNTGREEGFCFYNHVAVAARYAQIRHHVEKVLIVDWDYHHGNGTELAFYADPSVLFFSTHDWMAYPLTGDPSRKGEGNGEGLNINVHLDCGSGDREFVDVFEQQLLPAAHAFKPDLVLISCGFDSRSEDILGCHQVSDQGFAQLTRMVCDLADEFASGRVVSVLEGGYGIDGTATASEAHLRVLMQ